MSCLSHGSAFCAEDAAHLNGALPDTPVGAESYAVFPGIALIYNCFTDCDTGSLPGGGDGILVIDHCRGGRVEYAASGALCFLAAAVAAQSRTAPAVAGRNSALKNSSGMDNTSLYVGLQPRTCYAGVITFYY